MQRMSALVTVACLASARELQVPAGGLELEGLLRKEPRAMLEEVALSTQSPNSDFDSSSGVWKEIRKRANVTAVEPFSAAQPPSVVYASQTASAAATLVIGLVTCLVAVAWLLAAQKTEKAAWKTLDLALSFFCALLLYFILREISNLLVDDAAEVEEVPLKGLKHLGEQPAMARSGTGAVMMALLRFFLALAVHQAVLVAGRGRRKLLLVSSSFGAQLVGLLAADAFATWQEAESWASPGANVGYFCISVAVLLLLVALAAFLRSKVSDGEEKELFLAGDEQITALGLSLTLVQALRFVLAGRLPHFLGLQRSEYQRSETTMLCICLPFFVLIAMILERASTPAPEGPRQALRLASRVFAYGAAWASFFCAKWIDYGVLTAGGLASAGDVLKGEMCTSICLTALGFAGSIACQIWCQKLELKILSVFSEVICFSMCLSWHNTFQMACAFSKEPGASEFNQTFARCTQCQWMCILLIPSWLFFVHPRVHGEEGEKEGQQSEEDAKEGSREEEGDAKEGAKEVGSEGAKEAATEGAKEAATEAAKEGATEDIKKDEAEVKAGAE